MPTEADRCQKASIRDMFTRISAHYDLINRLLSLGQDQRCRRVALAAAQVPAGGALLDVASGTGDLALMALRRHPSSRVVGADLTPAMLRLAREKSRDVLLPWVVSDGLALSFADASFDAVTSAFMMRNVPDVSQALAEQARVTRPGGHVVCLEMSWPRRAPMSWLFGLYFFGVPPLLGWLMAGTVDPYRYLPRSVKDFIEPEQLAEKMVEVGLRHVTWRMMMVGTVAIHIGVK